MNFAPNVLLLSASIADIIISLYGLAIGLVELNPLMASHGLVKVLVWKVIATLFVVFALRSWRGRLGGLAFIPGIVVSLVVLWNLLNVTAQLL